MSSTQLIRVIILTSLLGGWLFCAVAFAQQPGTAPVVTGPAQPPQSQLQPAPIRPEPVMPPLAPPPPDPQPANWGDYAQPAPPLVAPLVLDYAQVPPPTGILQPNTIAPYRAPAVNADQILARDTTMFQAIDLWRPDGLAPVGVTQDATLHTGQFLFSYRFNYQSFNDNFVGTHKVSDAAVGAAYPFTPTHMETNRNLLILQYGVTEDLTIFGQLPFQHSNLDYTQTGGADYRTGFTEPADITISGMYVLWRGNRQQIHLNAGMNFPVGFLDSQREVPSPTEPNLPYIIRTGSGTYDLLPGLTYRGQTDAATWGVQSIGVVRTGSNRLDYRLGDRVDLTGWYARRFGERLSASFRLDWQWWDGVRNADPRLDQALSPTNDPLLQGGNRLDVLFGLNLFLPDTRLPGQRLSIEAGAPAFQNLHGPQLGTNWLMTAGWNWIY
ncbi:MAG: transporter [Singulisphaera sp.]